MTEAQAENAVSISALAITGIYLYRKLTEPAIAQPKAPHVKGAVGTMKGVFGAGPPLPFGRWVTGAGVTFIGLAIAASADPDFGGYMAILVATGAVLGNGLAASKDLHTALSKGANPEAGKIFGEESNPLFEGSPSLQRELTQPNVVP